MNTIEQAVEAAKAKITELEAKNASLVSQFDAEQKAHGKTKELLTAEQSEHSKTKADLSAEQVAHTKAKESLASATAQVGELSAEATKLKAEAKTASEKATEMLGNVGQTAPVTNLPKASEKKNEAKPLTPFERVKAAFRAGKN